MHLPLSAEAQAEARTLMLASDNILKPADGHTVTMPSQDMILGLYYLSTVVEGAKGQGRVFSSLAEAQMALDLHEIDMQSMVLIRLPEDFALPKDWEPRELKVVDAEPGSPDTVREERFRTVPSCSPQLRPHPVQRGRCRPTTRSSTSRCPRASSPRSSTTSRPAIPLPRWPPRWTP